MKCVHFDPDQAVAHDGQTVVFQGDRVQDSGGTKWDELCVHINDAWFSSAVKVDRQWFQDVELLFESFLGVCVYVYICI